MPDAVAFVLDDGTTVAVAPVARTGTGAVGLGDRLAAAEKTLRQALAPVTTAAGELMESFRRLGHRPDEVEISFGVTLDGRLGGVIASANSGAHLEVKLHWSASGPAAQPDPQPAAPEPA